MIRVVVDTPHILHDTPMMDCMARDAGVMAAAGVRAYRNAIASDSDTLPFVYSNDILPGYRVTIEDAP